MDQKIDQYYFLSKREKMGNQQHQNKSVETFILKYLPQLNYKVSLNDTLVYKTVLCTIEEEGPIVCKFHFSKIDPDFFKYLETEMDKIRKVFDLFKHPNILVYDKIYNFQSKALLGVRQFVCHNLKEKLHRIPKLATIEKKWLVFQLLCGVAQIHSEKMVHGDIKPSNILLTSQNWLFVADHVYYKPTFLGQDDLKQYNLYFGELDNNLRCYIAPERFRADLIDPEQMFNQNFLDPAMDIFSAGCVIAEIFMDGHPLFDLAHHQNYRKGLYDPTADLAKKIRDPKIVKLIMKMISTDPQKRGDINEIIIKWKEVFPRSFHQIYFHLASSFVRPKFLFSDMKISLVRKYLNAIWFSCFGKKDATKNFGEPVDPFVFERVREDQIADFEAYLVPSNDLFVFLNSQRLQGVYEGESQWPAERSQEDRDSVVVAVHWVGSLIGSCFYPQTRTCALEMLYKMALESSIDIRLQFVLPYVLQAFDDDCSRVKAKAIEVAVLMFEDVLEKAELTTLTSTDYKVFDNYIFPAFLKLKNETKGDQYIQHVFVRYLPLLAQIGHRFLELSIGSRFQKRHANKASQSNVGSSQIQVEEFKDESQPAEDDDEQERLFSQSENLMTSTLTRNTVVIRDQKHPQARPDKSALHKQHQDAQEVVINYDNEYDKLRRIILSLINDILSETEPSLQRLIYQNLGTLSVFFGRKMTIDNLIPLSNSCINKKDFMLKVSQIWSYLQMECLKGIPYLGLRVGQITLAKYLLVTCTYLLYDAEEIVVCEMIKTLNKLLEFGLLSKADSLENLEKLMPLLLYPNAWVRESVLRYIKFLADPYNNILTKGESYCLIRNKLKRYLKKGEKVYEICGDDLTEAKLKPPLSRLIYLSEMKGTPKVQTELSAEDQEAKQLLEETLKENKKSYQSLRRGKQPKEQEIEDYMEEFKLIKDRTKTYRFVPTTVVAQLSQVVFGNQINTFGSSFQQKKVRMETGDNFKQQQLNPTTSNNYQKKIDMLNEDEINDLAFIANDFRENLSQQEYMEHHFYPQQVVDLSKIDELNYGLNKRALINGFLVGNFEYDFQMQGQNLLNEDPEISLVHYKNQNLFQHLAVQPIQIGSQIYIEQSSPQPQQMPQFDSNAKTVQVTVNQGSSMFYQLGNQRYKFNQWRPTGRLITTLFEHKSAVNALAITDDSQFFFTGSKLDNMVNIWRTKDIEQDVTSHSAFSIKCKRQVNAITTIDNSNYFAVASSQGCIEIYQMGRVEHEFSQKISERRQASRRGATLTQNNSIVLVDQQSEPNHTSILKTIERKDEGDVTLCSNMILPIQQQHLLAYVTQRGSLYFHDLRSRFDVSSQKDLFGCQRGLATCMTLGQDPYQLYFGTIGGYLLVYDVRYNLVSSFYKHASKSPINSIAAFNPGKGPYTFNRSDYTSPMALVSAGSQNYEVSLLNLATGDVEVLLTVDDKKNRDNFLQGLPQIPSYQREVCGFFEPDWGKRQETNSSLFRRYLQCNRSSKHFLSIMSMQQQQLIRNLDEEWLKNSKNRYMMVKTSFESSNACRKILVPRKFTSMLHSPETVTYAITGGNDKKLRFWDFTSLKKKSFLLNSPTDDECQYLEEFQGDTLVVQEKLQQFKTFPPITAQVAQKQMEGQTNIYFGILNNLSQAENGQSGYQGLGKSGAFQTERVNDQEVVLNFNGLSEWQHLNGVSMNQGCGAVGTADAGSIDYHYRDSQNVSHQDTVLELGMLELSNQEPILVSCGRDGLVKLWR